MTLNAVVSYKGFQLNVKPGKELLIPFSSEKEVGQEIEVKEALFVQKGEEFLIGSPTLPIQVTFQVTELVKDKKVIVFKHSRKHKHHRKMGHRQKYLKVLVSKVELP